MKERMAWDDSRCLIGSPCTKCIKECKYRKTYSLDKGQEEKEKENERISESNEERKQL